MANILMVIAQEGFRDEEYFHPKEVLEGYGNKITTASLEAGSCEGKLGSVASADISLKDARPSFDAIVFVGGGGAQVFFDDPTAHSIAKDMDAAGKVVSAICIGPSILANAGLLKGRKATSYISEKNNLTSKGATFTGDPVTIDGNIVTANGPAAAKAFGEAIAGLLDKENLP